MPAQEDSVLDIRRLRDDTPGCAERIHLNNAGASLMPAPVIRAIQDHITLEGRIGGYEAADARSAAIQAAYQSVAALLGTAAEHIAFTESATASYAQALSSVPFERGDVILTTRNDYVSNQIQFLSLQARFGVQVVRAPDRQQGGVDVQAMRDLIRVRRPKIVCVTHVPTNSGLVQDVRAIGEACREAEVLYLVDACQSVGHMPVNVLELQCDFLSAASRKYLRGPRGAGFLYVSDRVLARGLEPLFIDLRGAEWLSENQYRAVADARRYESFEFAWALVLGTGEAARYAAALGLPAIRERIYALADRLRRALAAIERVKVLDRGEELCGIVSIFVDGWNPRDLLRTLRIQGINTNAQIRAYAVIDYDEKGVERSLRLSPHYFNTEEEIDRAAMAIRDLLLHGPD
jgi:selenocysteine lyase/cysteine desulfurase